MPPDWKSPTARIHAVEDRSLVADLLGAAAHRVQHVPVSELLDAGDDELLRLGLAQADRRRLLAAAELARRFQPTATQPPSYERSRDFLPHLVRLRARPVELLGVFPLHARLGLLDDFRPVAGGAVMHTSVSAREVFGPAIERQAAAIVLAHNHPSGDPEPSPEDLRFTRVMADAGRVLGIRVMNHLIVARRGFFSFVDAGLL